MKKFIEELKKANNHLQEVSRDTAAKRKFRELHQQYSGLEGRRALYRGGRGEARVVTISKAYPSYVRLSYPVRGRGYSGVISVCAHYGAILCGDDRLEVE